MPVNLLVVVPTVVAVSSTVDNKTILPEHLVDGKLDTAWNSRTNELAGAWVAVRLPADAHVDEIRLTAGFTKVDKKLGDLFTMNPRIKRVRIWHDGKQLAERDLDVESRALQALPIDGTGGDYKIEVVDFVAGTKKAWREMPISELEVWGTPGPSVKPGKATPVVRVGSLDKQPLTHAECAKALPPERDGQLGFDTIDLDGELAVCEVAQRTPGTDEGVASIALVKRGSPPKLVAMLPDGVVYQRQQDMGQAEAKVSLSTLALTTTESVLQVDQSTTESGPMYGMDKTVTTLYRVTARAATPILTYESSSSGGETGESDRCTLMAFTPGEKPPAKLAVTCVHNHSGYPGNKEDKDWEKTRTERYRWNGTSYAK